MVSFVGAGPGAADLITVRGLRRIEQADVIIYAGSLVNPELLCGSKEGCAVYDSAAMTLPQVLDVMRQAEERRLCTVRLHSGDPSLYGAIREQMDALSRLGIPFECVPGVSSLCAAAAALRMEYTVPGISQSVILTRAAGHTPVPPRESIASFAAHRATMVVFLSAGLLGQLQGELLSGGYAPETPAAIVYRASWPDEKRIVCTAATLEESARREHVEKTALVIVGDAVVPAGYELSRLYDPAFSTAFRAGTAGA